MRKRVTSLVVLTLTLSIFLQPSKQGKCPFGYGQDKEIKPNDQYGSLDNTDHPRVLQGSATYPSEVLTCPANKVLATVGSFSQQTYEQIVNQIIAHENTKFSEELNTDAACILRLAGHDFMDFRSANGGSSGGSDGCINFNDADNAGLQGCIVQSNIVTIYQNWCDQVSLADFIVIAAEAMMTRTASNYNSGNPFAGGTLGETFRNRFRSGRVTQETCPSNIGLMPDAEQGCNHLESIFVNNIYNQCVRTSVVTVNDDRNDGRRRGNDDDNTRTETVIDHTNAWRFTAAISGAHTLGQARISNSGFNGHWSDATNQGKFNNDYYRSLLLKGWGPELSINGNGAKNQWKRVDRDIESNGHHELMLNSDMCLAYRNDRINGYLTATNGDNCCGWTDRDILFDNSILIQGQSNAICGTSITQNGGGGLRGSCCRDLQDRNNDCDDEDDPNGPAIRAVLDFAASEQTFFEAYTQAWWLATENGVHEPTFDCKPPEPDGSVEEIGHRQQLIWSTVLALGLIYLM